MNTQIEIDGVNNVSAGYERRKAEILSSRSVSFALKTMIHTAHQRDPVDALSDADLHFALCNQRVKELHQSISSPSEEITHKLKIEPEFFTAILTGHKRFELRKNDRSFQVNDFLQLCEHLGAEQRFTGRKVTVQVLFMIVGEMGLPNDVACLSITPPLSTENC